MALHNSIWIGEQIMSNLDNSTRGVDPHLISFEIQLSSTRPRTSLLIVSDVKSDTQDDLPAPYICFY